MMIAAYVLLLAGPGAPTPTPSPTRTPTRMASPTPVPPGVKPAGGNPSDLSSYAGRVKVDRSKAEAIFRTSRSVSAEAPRPASQAPAEADAGKGVSVAPPGEEARWRDRAASLRRDLDLARAEKATTERNLPPAATSSEGTAQRNTLLYTYQLRVDRAQAALEALEGECRLSPTCQPGWVR